WIVCNGREKALGDGDHVIGRDADVAIPLPSPTVSRRHAKIVVAGAVATLEDVGSKNGTYVRGHARDVASTIDGRRRDSDRRIPADVSHGGQWRLDRDGTAMKAIVRVNLHGRTLTEIPLRGLPAREDLLQEDHVSSSTNGTRYTYSSRWTTK